MISNREFDEIGDDDLVTRAVFTQEETLQRQLQWGVRFLDIRIAYCKFLLKSTFTRYITLEIFLVCLHLLAVFREQLLKI